MVKNLNKAGVAAALRWSQFTAKNATNKSGFIVSQDENGTLQVAYVGPAPNRARTIQKYLETLASKGVAAEVTQDGLTVTGTIVLPEAPRRPRGRPRKVQPEAEAVTA